MFRRGGPVTFDHGRKTRALSSSNSTPARNARVTLDRQGPPPCGIPWCFPRRPSLCSSRSVTKRGREVPRPIRGLPEGGFDTPEHDRGSRRGARVLSRSVFSILAGRCVLVVPSLEIATGRERIPRVVIVDRRGDGLGTSGPCRTTPRREAVGSLSRSRRSFAPRAAVPSDFAEVLRDGAGSPR